MADAKEVHWVKTKKKKSWQTLKSGAAGAPGVCAGETEVGQFAVVAVLKKYNFKLIINDIIIETKFCEKKHLAELKQKNYLGKQLDFNKRTHINQ